MIISSICVALISETIKLIQLIESSATRDYLIEELIIWYQRPFWVKHNKLFLRAIFEKGMEFEMCSNNVGSN